jgi:3-hydroxybutyryl-CoA dehydrogenase
MTVLLADARPEAVADAEKFCADMIGRKAAKGQLKEPAEAVIGRIRATDAGPANGYAAFGPCHLVIEAAAERMDVKHAVLAGLEAAVTDDCIIATNTSSLSVTASPRQPNIQGGSRGFTSSTPCPSCGSSR